MHHSSMFLPLLVIALLPGSATPQSEPSSTVELDPYAITADPSASRLPDLSTAATVLDATDLQGKAGTHLSDTLSLVPNLNWAGGSNRPRFLQLRGIGERSQFVFEGPPNYSVGVLVDDIDVSGLGQVGDLFDVDSVEVLRGPQAAIYGSRALAGLVSIRTNDPEPNLGGEVEFGAGTDDLFRVGLALTGPLTDTLSARVAIHHHQQNGFHDARFLDRQDTNGRHEWTGRAKLRWQPSDAWTSQLTLLRVDQDNGYDVWAPDNNQALDTYSDRPGKDAIDFTALALRNTWIGTGDSRVLSITTWSEADLLYSYDGDWGNDAYWAGAPYFFDPVAAGFSNDFFDETRRTRETVTQDLRWISDPDGRLFNDTTHWHVGVYGSRLEESDDYNGFGALQSEYQADSIAGYGQTSTALSPFLQLTTALRVEHRRTDYADDQGLDAGDDETMSGGRISLEQIGTRVTSFVAVSRGFKGSGVNQDASLPVDKRFYDEETVWNYETGFRTEAEDGRWKLDVTAFWMERRDLQISTSFQADPADPTSFAYFTDNAAEGENRGIEATWQAEVIPSLTWFGATGLLDTEYSAYESAGGTNPVVGREQPHAPSYTFLTGLVWQHQSGWFARAEIEGKDGFYYSDSHDEQAASHELLHLSAGWAGDLWSVTLWGRNVLDERYAVRGFYFGLEPPDYADTLYESYGDPAQFGATVRRVF